MENSPYTGDVYRTSSDKKRLVPSLFPSLYFYYRMLDMILVGNKFAKKGTYDKQQWIHSSLLSLDAAESVGISINIEGMNNYKNLSGPCVFVGNHMSTLETFLLPSIIEPFKTFSYVLKKELTEYPIFGNLINASNPIVVGRENPREDLKAVLEGGSDFISKGTSVLVFPQTTRTSVFDPKHFNSIGVKLAKKSNVPIIPIALRTDAWSNGRLVKDFGKIKTNIPVYIKFGEPIYVKGKGDEELEKIIEFIQTNLNIWFNDK